MTHCSGCEIKLRPNIPYYRDVIHHVELCLRCAQSQILSRMGLEFVPVYRGRRA